MPRYNKMEDKVIYARDIDDCSNCPLYEKDCPGGWTSSGSGTPIEPPCTSWNSDEEIYEGMYDRNYRDYEYAEVSYKKSKLANVPSGKDDVKNISKDVLLNIPIMEM